MLPTPRPSTACQVVVESSRFLQVVSNAGMASSLLPWLVHALQEISLLTHNTSELLLALDQERWRRSETKLEQKTLPNCWLFATSHTLTSLASNRTAFELSLIPSTPSSLRRKHLQRRKACPTCTSESAHSGPHSVSAGTTSSREASDRVCIAAPESKLLTQLCRGNELEGEVCRAQATCRSRRHL